MSDNQQLRAQLINNLKSTKPLIVRQPSNNQIRITKNNRLSDYGKMIKPLLRDYISFESTLSLSSRQCFGDRVVELNPVIATPRLIEETEVIVVKEPSIISEQSIEPESPKTPPIEQRLEPIQQVDLPALLTDKESEISVLSMSCKTKIIGELSVLSFANKKSDSHKITHRMFMMSKLNKFKKDQPNTVKQDRLKPSQQLTQQTQLTMESIAPTIQIRLNSLKEDSNQNNNQLMTMTQLNICDQQISAPAAQKAQKPTIRLPLKQEVSTLNQQSLMFGMNSICEMQECFVNSFPNRQLKFYTINQDLQSLTPKNLNFQTKIIDNSIMNSTTVQKVDQLKFSLIKSDKIPIIQAFIVISNKGMKHDEQINFPEVQRKFDPFGIKTQEVLKSDKQNRVTKLKISNQIISENCQFSNLTTNTKTQIKFICQQMITDSPSQINQPLKILEPFISVEQDIKDVIILSKGQPQYPTLLEMNRIKLEKIKQIIVGGKSPKEFLKLKDFVTQNSSPIKNKKVKERDYSPKFKYISQNGSLILDEKNENVKNDKKRSCSIDRSSQYMQMSKNQSSVLNRFKKVKYLGKGNMSDVYSVVDQKTGMALALKTIQKSLIIGKGIATLITNEIKVQMHLQHPNILRCYGVLDDDKQIALILELSDQTLYSYIRNQQKIERVQMINILQQVLTALNHLHNNGIMHRDIKPENILMCKDVIKLADLGISIIAESCAQYCGTIGYMAPEIKQNQTYTNKVDCYSIGVLIYEMMFKKISSQTLYPLKNLKSDPLIDLMNKLIQPDPNQRYSCKQALEHEVFDKKDKLQKNEIDYQIAKLLF